MWGVATASRAEAEVKGRNKPGRASPTYTQPGLMMSPPGPWMAEDLARCHAGRTPWEAAFGVAKGRYAVDASLQGPGREAPSSCSVLALATNKA